MCGDWSTGHPDPTVAAGCFGLKLALLLGKYGIVPTSIGRPQGALHCDLLTNKRVCTQWPFMDRIKVALCPALCCTALGSVQAEQREALARDKAAAAENAAEQAAAAERQLQQMEAQGRLADAAAAAVQADRSASSMCQPPEHASWLMVSLKMPCGCMSGPARRHRHFLVSVSHPSSLHAWGNTKTAHLQHAPLKAVILCIQCSTGAQ